MASRFTPVLARALSWHSYWRSPAATRRCTARRRRLTTEAVFVNVGKSGRLPGNACQREHAVRPVPERAGAWGVAFFAELSYSTPAQRGLQISSGRADAPPAFGLNFTSGEFFKTASRGSSRPADPMPGATREPGSCEIAASTCWARTTMTRRAPALCTPDRWPAGRGATASQGSPVGVEEVAADRAHCVTVDVRRGRLAGGLGRALQPGLHEAVLQELLGVEERGGAVRDPSTIMTNCCPSRHADTRGCSRPPA